PLELKVSHEGVRALPHLVDQAANLLILRSGEEHKGAVDQSLRFRDATLQHIQGEVDVLPLNHQGRHQSDRTLAATENKQSLLKSAANDPVFRLNVGLASLLVFHQLDANHQP